MTSVLHLDDVSLHRGSNQILSHVGWTVVEPSLIPPWLSGRNRELLERSLRLAEICELALGDDGAAMTALQAQRRSGVLRPLLAVARHGAAAATEWWAR